ncbi:MAG TPA: M28 family peptidase, partial [Nannocystis exedens]|nr:M28 family peptidase [Nannocystis exedens]
TLIREVSKLKGPRFDMRASRLRSKLERVIEAGAVGAIVVRGPRSFIDRDARSADVFQDLSKSRISGDPLPIPVIQMKWREADRYLRIGSQKLSGAQASIDRDLEPKSRAIRTTLELKTDLETITTAIPNVLAKIPGSDLADELVIFGAHYDHIGADDGVGDCTAQAGADGVRDTICNGADDNASGTAMIMEIARAFVERGERPRRTLIFAHFAGEELGLLGSEGLAKDPPFDMTQVKAMINLDMVGRLGPRGLAIGGIGSSDAWMPLLDAVGTKDMSVLYEASVATRSDHASFYRKSIPVLFFFTGTHSDYHRPGDHTEKINIDGMQSIGDMVADVSLALADGLKIAYAKPSQGDGFSGGLPGSNPETVIKRVKRGRSANSTRAPSDAPKASPKTSPKTKPTPATK